MLVVLGIVVAVALLDLAAWRWGADTRDGRDWKVPVRT